MDKILKTRPKWNRRGLGSSLMALLGGLIVCTFLLIPTCSESVLSIDRKLGDSVLYRPGVPQPNEDLVFLAIDEDSLNLSGLDPEMIFESDALSMMSARFPWDRRLYALAIDRLLAAEARLVVLDLVLSGESTVESDSTLAEAIATNPEKVILASAFSPISSEEDGFMLVEPNPIFLATDPEPRFGTVNLRPHPKDGIIRNIKYQTSLAEENGYAPIPNTEVHPSLSGAVLEALEFEVPEGTRGISYSTEGQRSEGTRVYQPISIRSLFISDDWEHRFQSGAFFKDKIVMIGPSASTFQDIHQTPVGLLKGPQIHLQAIASGISGEFLRRPFEDSRREALLFALGGTLLAGVFVWLVRSPIIAFCGVVCVVIAAFVFTIYLPRITNIWIGSIPFILAFVSGAITGQTYDLIRERIEKSRLHNQFRRFVSRDVADSLVLDPSIYKEAALGRKRRVIVLFSDIRGFTSLSENIPPEELFAQLNEYLSAMVRIIFEHGGTLDKFIGDAIMAHWGALADGSEKDFAISAVAATKEMTAELTKLNKDWKARNLPELEIGVGLHLGEVLAGEIGSQQRTEFGVIGDAVNLASRLEGLTKAFSCPWLASGDVIRAIGQLPGAQKIAKVRVKGRKEPVELWGISPCEPSAISYAEALATFEAGDFEAAYSHLERHTANFVDDQIANQLFVHTKGFRKTPPDKWEGIIEFTEK